ncbi:ATP-dependent RNA helicase DDX6/DHH1 [Enteropsectra breve]|nr:ATP-dependent RNA helicase DDX6/DHH1 [Enteropsectra breve]
MIVEQKRKANNIAQNSKQANKEGLKEGAKQCTKECEEHTKYKSGTSVPANANTKTNLKQKTEKPIDLAEIRDAVEKYSNKINEESANEEEYTKNDVFSGSLDEKSNINEFEDTKWTELGIKENIAVILEENGLKYPSPVQAKSIPVAISGRDMLVRARNGTGKTASFVVPIINKIDTTKGLQAIILVPIRELALQVAKAFLSLGRSLGVKSVPIIGGKSFVDDILRVQSEMHVLIGTPGRVVGILKQRLCKIEPNCTVVLDEADKLLDNTFYSCVSDFMGCLPRARQMLLYSATFPRTVEGFVTMHMHDPVKLVVSTQDLKNISQYFIQVDKKSIFPCLEHLLKSLYINKCVIYCNSKTQVMNLANKISGMRNSVYFIHSGMEQEERNLVYHNFLNNDCRILVSTDLTTRGINIPRVNLVINYELPSSSESYLHRIGRAGRFGRKGCAVNLIRDTQRVVLDEYVEKIGTEALPASDPSFREFYRR